MVWTLVTIETLWPCPIAEDDGCYFKTQFSSKGLSKITAPEIKLRATRHQSLPPVFCIIWGAKLRNKESGQPRRTKASLQCKGWN